MYKYLSWSYRTNTDELIGMIHHGDEEIKKHDDVDDREASEHDETPESREFFDSCQLEVVQVYQTESRPKQCLWCLPQTEK